MTTTRTLNATILGAVAAVALSGLVGYSVGHGQEHTVTVTRQVTPDVCRNALSLADSAIHDSVQAGASALSLDIAKATTDEQTAEDSVKAYAVQRDGCLATR